jgi:acyl transferase domain-containing protein
MSLTSSIAQALVTGSSVILAPDSTLSLMNMSFLSPQGRCHSFDDRADGYSRGEGFGVVLLKRLSDALRDKNTIRAVVRSTGSNQDGHTPGVTQPSCELQALLIKETYEKAGLSFQNTRYFEAHGMIDSHVLYFNSHVLTIQGPEHRSETLSKLKPLAVSSGGLGLNMTHFTCKQ